MKIKVLFTGGTIGSEANGSFFDVGGNTSKPLFEHYYKQNPNSSVEFDTSVVLNVLSENISFENWMQLYNALKMISRKDCDGVIITYGTDTLAYTSSFLAFMLCNLDIPVLLVSSDLPLEDANASGYQNFAVAVDFIVKQHTTKGVFVPIFKEGKTYIHLGSRLTQAQPFTHCFRSLSNVYFGTWEAEGFSRNKHEYNPKIADLNSVRCFQMNGKYDDHKNVVYIKPFPGLNYDMFDFKDKPSAILHELYHSGTACTQTSEPRYSIINFAKKCIANGIDFYAAPFDPRNAIYVTSKEMHDIGVKFMSNMSAEAAYIKLNVAYGFFDTKEEITSFVDTNIAFERLF